MGSRNTSWVVWLKWRPWSVWGHDVSGFNWTLLSFNYYYYYYWRVIALQCCFCCSAAWISYNTYMPSLLRLPPPQSNPLGHHRALKPYFEWCLSLPVWVPWCPQHCALSCPLLRASFPSLVPYWVCRTKAGPGRRLLVPGDGSSFPFPIHVFVFFTLCLSLFSFPALPLSVSSSPLPYLSLGPTRNTWLKQAWLNPALYPSADREHLNAYVNS